MIKPVRAWIDGAGTLHPSREDACKAEFRRLLLDYFKGRTSPVADRSDQAVEIDDLVEAMFDIDKMIGEATKEDSRADVGT